MDEWEPAGEDGFEMAIVTVVLEVPPDETPEDVVARFMPVAWAAGALKGDD